MSRSAYGWQHGLLKLTSGAQESGIAFAALQASLPPLSAPSLTCENISLLAPAALATTPFPSDIRLPECPQLKIVRIDGSLYFGAISHVRQVLLSILAGSPGQKHLQIVASGINLIDMTGAGLLLDIDRLLRRKGGNLYLYNVKEEVCDHFNFFKYLLEIGAENIFESKAEAIAGIFAVLDRDICRHCQARIFKECATVPMPGEENAPPHANGLLPTSQTGNANENN